MLHESIAKFGLNGRWKKGGQLQRVIYINEQPHGNYLINWDSKNGRFGTWWCQCKASMNTCKF